MKTSSIKIIYILLLFFAANLSFKSYAEPNAKKQKKAKYVFFFIGDGMSSPQINMAEAALNEKEFKDIYYGNNKKNAPGESEIKHLCFSRFPAMGMATTFAQNRYITGSAAAATALATGHKTTINTIGKNGDHTKNYKNIAEQAKEQGKKIGIITSVSIDHATPAGFYAHVNNRNDFEKIDNQMIKTGFDYFAGGSVRFDTWKDKNIEQYKKEAAKNGYTYINTKTGFNKLNRKSGKVIATISLLDTDVSDGKALPYNIDLGKYKEEDKITLASFTKKGIELLDNPKGFFMMVEGGKIDWTGHANDVATNIQEVFALDKAIKTAYDFYLKHPDETLIIVTGDHETGGLTLGFAGTGYSSSYKDLSNQNISFKAFADTVDTWKKDGKITFEEAMEKTKKYFGLGNADLPLTGYEKERLHNAFIRSTEGKTDMSKEEEHLAYGKYDPFTVTITHILNNKAGVNWATYAHTALPVPVFAIGARQDLFNGYYDNTDIPKKISSAAGLNLFTDK